MSFIVTYPTLIGLVAGSDRLKNYLIQVKDDLFLIDFHSTEMSFIDIKPAFSSYVFFWGGGRILQREKIPTPGTARLCDARGLWTCPCCSMWVRKRPHRWPC